ncbi:substrate-binding domain-containing protein [Comamonadaceae bacterium M7527]|nr:substrate-binding domain-containing protein [Comamonadaceae bacterium M7527]
MTTAPAPFLTGISSMATRALLAQLLQRHQDISKQSTHMLSIGGVDALKRIQTGEAFDIAVLASDAIAKLVASGHALATSVTPVVHSAVAVAVPVGATTPDLSTEASVRAAVLAAPSISYSTGPSGVALATLFERWGIAGQVASKTITPPPGTPVASLLASGQAALGFQQRSELLGVDGIQIVGPLPSAIQITTTFSACVLTSSQQPQAAAELLTFLASDAAAAAKKAQGMTPA